MAGSYLIAPKKPRRSPCTYLLLLALTLCAGYASRRFSYHLPIIIRKRTGDALWATAVFLLLALVRPRWSTLAVTVVALLISYTIEFTQIYHRPWIDHLRSFAIGRLILGTTFFWWDQVAYTIGITAIVPVDRLLSHRVQIKPSRNDA